MKTINVNDLKNTFLLNNLQGRLPSKYTKYKKEVIFEIQEALKQLKYPCYSKNRGFNAVHFHFFEPAKKEIFLIEKETRMDFSKTYLNEKELKKVQKIKNFNKYEAIQAEVSKF